MQPILHTDGSVSTFDFFGGTPGDDTLVGTDGNDTFSLADGGDDSAFGGGGDDSFSLGGAFTAADSLDGGEGNGDTLILSGDYHKRLVLAASTMSHFENITLFGAAGYNLVLDDANIAAGVQLTVTGSFLDPACKLVIDGSAETDGSFSFHFGANLCLLTGGAGSDNFVAEGDMNAGDRIKGGAGADGLTLTGPSYVFGEKSLSGIESLGIADFTETSHIVMADGNLAGRAVMTIRGDAAFGMEFDASAESSGGYFVYGSGGDDTLIGGAGRDDLTGYGGSDLIIGGRGADTLTTDGDGASDTIAYLGLADSTKKAPDLVVLGEGDVIDLSAIDARSDKAGDQAFRIVTAFDGHAGELVLHLDPKIGDVTDLLGDVDGDGKADLVIHLAGDQTGFTDFVL